MSRELTADEIAARYPDVDTTPATPWVTKSVLPSHLWFAKLDDPGNHEPIERAVPVFFVQERTYGGETETRVVPTIFDDDGYAVPAVDLPEFRGTGYGG